MANTFVHLWTTPYAVAYEVTHGAGPGTDTGHVDWTAGASPSLAVDCPAATALSIRNLLATPVAAQANARALFGFDTAAAGVVRGKATIIPRTGVLAADWTVDPNVVGGQMSFDVTAMNDGTAVLIIRRIHSTGR